MHRQFFTIISQNAEYVKTNCKDLYNPFHFACREWIFQKQRKISRLTTMRT